jgi:hypothetical protein
MVLVKGDTIIVWVCQGTRCHQHKENVSMGGFRIVSFVYDELGIINST